MDESTEGAMKLHVVLKVEKKVRRIENTRKVESRGVEERKREVRCTLT